MGRQYGALMKKELDEVLFVVDTVIEYNESNASKVKQILEIQTMQTPWRISQFFEAGLPMDETDQSAEKTEGELQKISK